MELEAFTFSWGHPWSDIAGSTELKVIPEHPPARDAFTAKGKLTAHTSCFALQTPILSPFSTSTSGAPAPRQHPRQPPMKRRYPAHGRIDRMGRKILSGSTQSFAPMTGRTGHDQIFGVEKLLVLLTRPKAGAGVRRRGCSLGSQGADNADKVRHCPVSGGKKSPRTQ